MAIALEELVLEFKRLSDEDTNGTGVLDDTDDTEDEDLEDEDLEDEEGEDLGGAEEPEAGMDDGMPRE
jgi:hypothetical protein